MQTLNWINLIVIVGSGMSGGIFFTFSNFVMPALARLPKTHGAAAMQQINITVLNPAALGVMLGTGLIALAAAVLALLNTAGTTRGLILAGAVIYIVGCVGVTIAGNVPLNERLDKVNAQTQDVVELWDHYLERWTFWNTVRTIACVATAVVFTLVFILP